MKRILVAEDEDVIRDFVVINLQPRRLRGGATCPTGDEALRVFDENERATLTSALLDIMMPGNDGFTVCKEIREQLEPRSASSCSRAKSQEMDKVSGLMLGADDYVTKPFCPVGAGGAGGRACYRRVTMLSASRRKQPDEIRSGPFVLNHRSRTLTKNGKNIDLTQVEFQIMECFMTKPQRRPGAQQTSSPRCWGENYFGDVKIVDVEHPAGCA